MPAFLSAREVCQRLRDAALEVVALQYVDHSRGPLITVDLEGWQLQLDFEGQRLHHCERARSADGREGWLDTWQRYGTDPVSLLSTWELTQLERMLSVACQRVDQ